MTASFSYDPFGRRTQKTVPGTSTTFLYDGANVAQEVIGGTNTANLLSGGVDEGFTRPQPAGATKIYWGPGFAAKCPPERAGGIPYHRTLPPTRDPPVGGATLST